MPTASAPLARELAERARTDTEFAAVLEAIRTAPTTPQGVLEHTAATGINEQRRHGLVDDFVAGALPTPQVQALLGVGSPQAVHRLRTRKKLLGAAVGNQTWFPAWQFEGGQLRADLPRILESLARFTTDAMAADRIMRLKHDELGGASIAAALGSPRTAETAWRLLAALDA